MENRFGNEVYAVPAPPHDSVLGQLENSVGQLRERLAQSTGELGTIADRCFGTRPEAAAIDKNRGNPAGSGMVPRLEAELEALTAEIVAIEERVKRLTAL